MTTGTKVLDLRTYEGSYCGKSWSGYYKSKTWSGTNQASAIVRPTVVATKYASDLFRLEPFIDKKGKRRIRKVLSGTKIETTRYRLIGQRPPKRARHYDEHDYAMDLLEYNSPKYRYQTPNEPGIWKTGNTACGVSDVTGWDYIPWSANNDAELLIKLREKLVGDFDVGMFLVESDKSLKMILNAAVRIDGFYRAVRQVHLLDAATWLLRGKRQTPSVKRRISRNEDARRALMLRAENILVNGRDSVKRNRRKAVANNWLELQYGWLPLLSDAFHGAEQLAAITADPMRRTVRTARVLHDNFIPKTTAPSTTGWGKGERTTLRAIKAVITEVNLPLLTGLTNPATMAWERLPFSFVVDWFLPIQNYLQARGVQQSVRGTFTYTLWQTRECSVLYPKGWTLVGGSDFYYRYKRLRRVVQYGLPSVPLPGFKPFNKAATWKHTLNALALLSQNRK